MAEQNKPAESKPAASSKSAVVQPDDGSTDDAPNVIAPVESESPKSK